MKTVANPMKMKLFGQRISSDKASNLPKRDVRFILLETRHIKQIYIDEPSVHHCPQFVYLKRGFLHAYNNSTSY